MSFAPSFQFTGYVAAAVAVVALFGGWKLGSSHWKERYLKAQSTVDHIRLIEQQQQQTAKAREKALQKQFDDEVKAHEESENRLHERADTAERNYARILQNGARRHECSSAPAAPHSPRSPGASTEPQRLGELAKLAREIGERAVHDATALAHCQSLLRAERQ